MNAVASHAADDITVSVSGDRAHAKALLNESLRARSINIIENGELRRRGGAREL